MRNSTIGSLCVVLAASMGHASGQSINIDVDIPNALSGAGAPASTFAAAGQPGTWNAAPVNATAFPLLDLSGAATNATVTITSGNAYNFNNLTTSGDDELLLDDLLDPTSSAHCTIQNLAAGVYTVITYAWAPDSSIYQTGVTVNGGPMTVVGGTFNGAYVQGVTHALDTVAVPAGGSITITLSVVLSFGSFNGVQLIQQAAGAPGSICETGPLFGATCPCGMSGAPGHGCPNSAAAIGALLASSGSASIASDTLSLSGSGMPPTGTCLYFQGTAQTAPTLFGDGLSCVGGSMTRLAVRTNAGGASAYPIGGEAPISVRGGATAGALLGYQVLYRDAPSFCTSATFNMPNGLFVLWAP